MRKQEKRTRVRISGSSLIRSNLYDASARRSSVRLWNVIDAGAPSYHWKTLFFSAPSRRPAETCVAVFPKARNRGPHVTRERVLASVEVALLRTACRRRARYTRRCRRGLRADINFAWNVSSRAGHGINGGAADLLFLKGDFARRVRAAVRRTGAAGGGSVYAIRGIKDNGT